MQKSDDMVPLTPVVVDCVTFDRAPLGRRGYNEDQVDDFLDRVQATLEGTDTLSAQEVRDAMFDPAPLIRRGYHEDQVDQFLDLVVAELERRGAGRQPHHARPPVGHPTPPHVPTQLQAVPKASPTEQTSPMAFSAPPSTPAVPPRPEQASGTRSPRQESDLLALPLPPAPPGERGYRPGDIERLMTMLVTAASDPEGPTADEVAKLNLARTFFVGQGYHVDAVEALRLAWVQELHRRAL